MAKRLNFSRKVMSQAKQRANGRCEKCSGDLKGTGEVDHILPDALGGKPELANAQVLCKPCHKEKTADDIKRIRKSDRQRDKALGAMKRPPRLIQSAGFAKAQKKESRINKSAVQSAAIPARGGLAMRYQKSHHDCGGE